MLYGQRLAEGFEIMGGDYGDDDAAEYLRLPRESEILDGLQGNEPNPSGDLEFDWQI